MKAYCLDTSGLSTPLENMPEDIHSTLWAKISEVVTSDKFAVTKEIYDELVKLPGPIGRCIAANKDLMQLEIEEDTWDWQSYVEHFERMRIAYQNVIAEYNGNRKNTIGLNDLSIVALAKTMKLPVVSSEKRTGVTQDSVKRQKIPDICAKEGVAHISFNDLLRAEGITN